MSSIGAWGINLLSGSGAQTGSFGNPYVRDYQHAAKTFLPIAYQNAPKLKFLFHTVFEINPALNIPFDPTISVLVKNVKLPGFNIETQQLNQYNRKRINQTKIKYDPVDITFHDDSGNLISSLWYRYYTYYYQDGLNPQVIFNGSRGAQPNTQNVGGGVNAGPTAADYNTRNQYNPSITNNTGWGYSGQGLPNNNPSTKIPFFTNITVFGINRHAFISYTLINPIITRFAHDTYDYEQGGGVMANTMSVDYETVVYNQGNIEGGANSGNIIKGFGDVSVYDKTPSPIMNENANQQVIVNGGMVNAAGGSVTSLAANILNAAQVAGAAYNTIKNTPTNTLIQGAVTRGIQTTLQSIANPTRNVSYAAPVYGQTGGVAGTAGSPYPAVSQPQPVVDASSTVNAGVVVPNPTTGQYGP